MAELADALVLEASEEIRAGSSPVKRIMVYVVIHTYGDYIGWFESDVIGVFDDETLAEKCRLDNQHLLKVWSQQSSLKVVPRRINKVDAPVAH